MSNFIRNLLPVVPAKAGAQERKFWIPFCNGTTEKVSKHGMTLKGFLAKLEMTSRRRIFEMTLGNALQKMAVGNFSFLYGAICYTKNVAFRDIIF
jgi:hypothetical protein